MSPPPPPAASPATSPAKTEAASGGGAKRPQPSAARVAGPPSESELVPGSRALSLDLGIARAVLGGYAYPRIGASGASDRRFRSHGDGAAFRLLYEHPAMDLDWRLALQGEAPAFLGARATVGVTKSIGPWRNPLVLTRAAAGVELMYAGEGPSAAHAVIPVVVGEAEAALRIDLVENRVSIGPVVALGLRYGLPLGAGYDAAALVRGSLRF